MIKDSAKKIFDVVLDWKLDRFARNRCDAESQNLDTDALQKISIGAVMAIMKD